MGETAGGALRRGSDRIVSGVCSGLAQYFHLDPTLVRVIFVVLALVPLGVGVILYLVLWFLMEPASSDAANPGTGRRVSDLIGGLRREFREPFGSPGRRHRSRLWGGIVLIAAGDFLVLANLGYLNGFRWDLLWPVLLVAAGLLVLVRRI